MTRRTLGALLIVTLAAGGAACSRVRTPATAPGLAASDSTTHPTASAEVVHGTPPAPVKQGSAESPPDSSEPAPEINPKGETLLPPLGFRPSLLLLLYTPGTRDSEEIYGYDLVTRQLGQLTEGGPGGATEIGPSPDGELFAYLRTEAGPPGKTAGLCARPIHGGVPVCEWDSAQSSLVWRPGTHDLYVRGKTGLAVFKVDTKRLSPIAAPPGLSYPGDFSPDGRWLTYDDHGLVLMSLQPGEQRLRLDKVKADGGHWIANDKLLVLHKDFETRMNTLLTVGVDGSATPLPLMTPRPAWITGMMTDVTGRYMAINHGIQGGTYTHSGVAIYSLARKEWQRIEAGGETAWAHGWVAQGRLLLSHGENQYALHEPESGKQTPLPIELKGHRFTSVSPDGDWLAFNKDKTLRLYQLSTGELRTVDTKGMEVVAAVWVPQAKPK